MDILNIYWVNSRDHITHFHDWKCIRDLQQPQKFSSLEFRKTNRCTSGSSNRPSRPTTYGGRGRHLRASILWRGRTTWSGTDRMDRLTTTWCTTAKTSGTATCTTATTTTTSGWWITTGLLCCNAARLFYFGKKTSLTIDKNLKRRVRKLMTVDQRATEEIDQFRYNLHFDFHFIQLNNSMQSSLYTSPPSSFCKRIFMSERCTPRGEMRITALQRRAALI